MPFIKLFYLFFLPNKTQQVKVNSSLSAAKYCNTGVPQGGVHSPILFTLVTNDCKSMPPNYYVINFLDDTIISLVHASDCPSLYHREIDACQHLQDSHYL